MEVIKNTLKKNDIIKVLRIKPFLSLMLSEFFSQTAFNMQHFVIIFIVYEVYHSNSAVSGVILSFAIPAIIFSVMAGVYVDRWDKKNVLFVTNLLRAIILLFFLIPNMNLVFIYFLTFLLAVITQFFLPAEAPMIPILVKKDLAISANAVFAMGIYTTVLIGYILAGPALLLIGRNNAFILLSALFFISSILILFIKSERKEKKKKMEIEISEVIGSFIEEFKQVIHFIRKTKKVTKALALLTFSQMIIFVFAALGPGYVAEILNVRVESLSWILLAPAAMGMIVGSVILGSRAKKINTKREITIGFLIGGIVFSFLPFGSRVMSHSIIQTINSYLPNFFEIDILHIIMLLAFLAGFANSLIFVPANATIQTETTDEFRGRVYGLLNALVGAVSLVPVAIAGGLADIFGVGRVILFVGLLILAVGFSRFVNIPVKRFAKN